MSNRKRRILVTLVTIVLIVLVVPALAVLAVEVRSQRTFEAPYPDLHATTDPQVVARGKALVFGGAACAYCHLPRDRWDELDAGATPPLTGAHRFPLPFGDFYSRNLTPDVETGIGARTDAELARTIRHGVLADGRSAAPLMAFPGMSDEDIVAVISFLRTQPAVRSPAREKELNLLGKALMAFAIEPPAPHDPPPPVHAPAEAPTVERGKYLVENVLSCGGCHSSHEREDGARYSGGVPMDAGLDPDHLYVPPNLTPEPKTGRIASWSEETFLLRFRGGPVYANGIMPWGAYRRLSDDDLRAVYRFLRTVPPVEHASGASMIDKARG